MDLTNPVILTLAILLAISVGLHIIQGWLNLFLTREMFKKFALDREFFRAEDDHSQDLEWSGLTCRMGWKPPGMGVLVFTHSEPFAVKLGFQLLIPIFERIGLDDWADTIDCYGFAESSKVARGPGQGFEHRIAISTWLGEGAVKFCFLVTKPGVRACIFHGTEKGWKDGGNRIDARYPPHFYQRLGFWA